MKLCYRGIPYDYNPPSLEVTESEIQGHYRGRAVQFSYVRHIPIPQPVTELTYRGIPYSTNTYGQIQQVKRNEVKNQGIFKANRARNPLSEMRRELLQEAALAHQANVRNSLRRRLAIAQAQGNQKLIEQLEAEQHELA